MALLSSLLHSTPNLHGRRFLFSPSRSLTLAASRRGGGIVAFSIQYSANLVKPHRRRCRSSPLYFFDDDEYDKSAGAAAAADSEDDEDDGDSDGDGDDDESEDWFDDDLSDLEYPGVLHTNRPSRPKKSPGGKERQSRNWDRMKLTSMLGGTAIGPKKLNSQGFRENATRSSEDLMDLEGEAKLQNSNFSRKKFQKLQGDVHFDEKWFPLINYLNTFGLKESHYISIYERHMSCLQINVASVKQRLEFLLSVGVKSKDMKRILVRQPQILEYTVSNLKSHVDFLVSIGVPNARIGQIVVAAPSLFSYSVEQSLKPTVRYLIEEVGIKESDVGKIVQLSPQILVNRIAKSWKSRFLFLSKEIGAPKDSIVKMVTKHPQLLHYSIEEGILPRIKFLRSIGMKNADILKVLTSLTQVLSLSLEENLKPKYLYLVNDLRNEVQSLTKYPMYLSLSLEQRIRPRHRFLVSLKKAPKGPFPLSSLLSTDECFSQHWAGTSLDKYLAFRESLLSTELKKNSERKRLTAISK